MRPDTWPTPKLSLTATMTIALPAFGRAGQSTTSGEAQLAVGNNNYLSGPLFPHGSVRFDLNAIYQHISVANIFFDNSFLNKLLDREELLGSERLATKSDEQVLRRQGNGRGIALAPLHEIVPDLM